MASYSSLLRKAGFPVPTGFAILETPKPPSRQKLSEKEKNGRLQLVLDAMVARGELVKTPNGRYGLPG